MNVRVHVQQKLGTHTRTHFPLVCSRMYTQRCLYVQTHIRTHVLVAFCRSVSVEGIVARINGQFSVEQVFRPFHDIPILLPRIFRLLSTLPSTRLIVKVVEVRRKTPNDLTLQLIVFSIHCTSQN